MNVLQGIRGGISFLNGKMNALRESKPIQIINQFINSKYMLAVVAVLTLLANILGIEFWVYLALGIVCLYVCLFGKDTLFFACIPLFMYTTPSVENNPFLNSNSFFYPENGLWFVIAFIALILVCYLFRIVFDWGFVKFVNTKRKFLYSLLTLGVVFLLGGIGGLDYTTDNLPYALVLFISFFLLYFMLTGTVNWKESPKEYFAWLGLFVGLTVALQLLNIYITRFDKIFVEGIAGYEYLQTGEYGKLLLTIFTGGSPRNQLYTGWGTYTSMSGVMAMCLPCAFYLASKRKNGVVFHLLGGVLYLAILASTCRGAILMGGISYIGCAVATLFSKKNRIANIVVYSITLVIVVTVLILARDKIVAFINDFLAHGLGAIKDNGREEIYIDGVTDFRNNPILGGGFFACIKNGAPFNPAGVTFMPPFYHNTIIQILASCGIVGLVVYIIHRAQTAVVVFKKPNVGKTFSAICIGTLLLICMVDCHIFNIGLTLYYSVFLAFMEKSDEQETEKENDFILALFNRKKTKTVGVSLEE